MPQRKLKPSKPRVIGATVLPQNRNIVEEIVDMVDPAQPGQWLRRKQGRRANNVFENLFVSGRIDGDQRQAAGDMAELFAKSRGLFNVTERSLERVQYDAADPHKKMLTRAAYAIRYHDILGRLDQAHARLLQALIEDFVLGDGVGEGSGQGTSTGRSVVRWRDVVRRTLGAACPRAPYEGRAVAEALGGLPQAVLDHRRMRAKNRPK